MSIIQQYNTKLVEITGGEPLLQSHVISLAQELNKNGFTVLVETNGSQDISVINDIAICIMDIKCPGSGESDKIDWNNLNRLKLRDEIKFVLSDKNDFDWAVEIVEKYELYNKNSVLFSPVKNKLEPNVLADWILSLRIPIRLQIQLHKYISMK